jgi:GWxTD domain-containing protein
VGLLAGLPVEQIELVLLHELAHIRRHDYLVNLLQSLIENLLFYHPAVWWLSKEIRMEREFCCDDIVVAVTADGPSYARALTNLERQRGFAYSSAMAATGGNLMTRVRRILGQPVATRNASAPLLGLLLLGAASLAIAWQPSVLSSSGSLVFPSAPKHNLTVEELIAQAQAPLKSRPAQPVLIAQGATPNQPGPNPQTTAPRAPSELERQTRAVEQARQALLESALRRRLEAPYEAWLTEDVFWIVTDAERVAFQRLQTNDERERFIEQFWLRRDPTPDTVENEFKTEYYRRLAWANDRLGGWKTDRGSIYIKYGAPDAKEEHPKAGPGVRPIEQGGGATTFFPYEQWHYTYLAGVGSDVILEFVDPSGTGEYRLTWNPSDKDSQARVSAETERALGALPKLSVRGAGLTMYEQMGLEADRLRDLARRNSELEGRITEESSFERLRRYLDVRRAPEKAKDTPQTRWLNEEAVYLISPEERSVFQRLSTDDERQKFIEQFWLRRDPTPDTARNEAKEQHYQRIALANERFATPDTAGWNTDRGAVYIVFGPPDEEVALGGSLTAGGGSPSELWRMIAWNYSRLDGVGEKISVKFDVEVAGSHPNFWRFASGTVEKPAPNTTAYRTFGQLKARQ